MIWLEDHFTKIDHRSEVSIAINNWLLSFHKLKYAEIQELGLNNYLFDS